jgi:hypothetical protein
MIDADVAADDNIDMEYCWALETDVGSITAA